MVVRTSSKTLQQKEILCHAGTVFLFGIETDGLNSHQRPLSLRLTLQLRLLPP